MSFLAPALLAALGLVAIPVLIHLTRRQRGQVTPFPSLMFLRKLPFRTTHRRRIRHPLLFALRCLAVVLIALAFARPFVSGSAGAADTAARDVVLLLDVSGSMASGPRGAAARDAARAALGELGEGDRAALVGFDDRAAERVPLTSDIPSVLAALADLPRTDRPTRIEAGLQLAGRILEESDRTRREVVLISDFQRSGWEDGGRTRLPDGVTLRTVQVGEPGANLAVGDVRISPDANDRHRVLVRVLNLDEAAARELGVTLELEGRVVGTRPLELEGRGAGTVLFEDVAIPSGAPRGRVMLEAPGQLDALATDDELRFIATPEPEVDVALVEAPRGRADRSLFLAHALELAERPGLAVARSSGGLDGTALGRAAVAVLNDATPGDGGASARLREWVAGGGALLVALGPESASSRWAAADSALLGGRVGEIADHSARGGSRLAWIDYDHPVFEVFAAPGSGDFSAARFWRLRRFDPGPGARVLARFEDGEPALVEHAVGHGRVLTWTSTLDRFWNDLALQPVFLPFVHRAVRHAANFAEPERWLEAGTSRELDRILAEAPGTAARETEESADPADPAADWVLVTPADERLPIEPGLDGGPRWIEFDRAGFYRVEPLEGGAPVVTVAVNLAPRESDLGAVAPERLAAAVVGNPGTRPGGGRAVVTSGRGAGAEREAGPPGRRELWWPILCLAAAALVLESWLANRWSTRRAVGTTGTGKETLP